MMNLIARSRTTVPRLQQVAKTTSFLSSARVNARTHSVQSDHTQQQGSDVLVSHHHQCGANPAHVKSPDKQLSKLEENKNVVEKAACGDIEDDEEMEQEEMFVDAHESFEYQKREWGGPRRGGRLPEPTRFGDWERKGRCTDF